MDNIRIGVVGSGGMAGTRAGTFSRTAGFRLTAVAARNPETGPALAEALGLQMETDWRRLVARDDVDAVVITTHNELHGAIALAALEAGKHVFSEYPIARFDEELDRLHNHIGEVRRVIGSGEPVGRRLDFLMQELNREANTLGSKSVVADTTNSSVELKVLIEQMREQVQNVE